MGELEISDTLSIFGSEAPAADARAFSKLMKHLKEVDGSHSTVIMVQVENEVGLLVPDDLVEFLDRNWHSLRPELKHGLKFNKASSASWTETIGHSKKTDELFMAYHYARYVNQVASAGRAEYVIPLYTNVWQNLVAEEVEGNELPVVAGGGQAPGDYPSGGGVINVIDIWQTFAPSLEFIAPDIYLNDYTKACAKYRHRNQPLFIPEQRRDEYGARRVWAAIGSYQALGTSPFGIDTLKLEENPFRIHYGLLAQVSKQVLEAQKSNSSVGFFFDDLASTPGLPDPSPPKTVAQFSPWILTIERSFVFGSPGSGWGMVIHQGDARFLLIGEGFQVRFAHKSAPFTGILRFEEKEVQKDGNLKTLRTLNGDETRGGKFCIMPNDEPDYGGFPICVTIPARTGIAEAECYALDDVDSV